MKDGTILASSMRKDGEVGPLEMVRADGSRCQASIRCTTFSLDTSGALWCLYVSGPKVLTAGKLTGPAAEEVEISYSNDSGRNWLVAVFDRRILRPEALVLKTADRLMLLERNSGQLWAAHINVGERSMLTNHFLHCTALNGAVSETSTFLLRLRGPTYGGV